MIFNRIPKLQIGIGTANKMSNKKVILYNTDKVGSYFYILPAN